MMPNSNKTIYALGGLLVVALIAVGVLYKQINALQNPNKAAQDEIQKVVAEVSALMVLPTNDQVTVATVTDPSKLKDQPFFANAKAGDKVLIYPGARKAILYSPDMNKIVEVSSLNLGQSVPQTSPQSATVATSTPKKK